MESLNAYTAKVEAALDQLIFPSSPKNLYDPLRYFLTLGGKRMRPILSLLGAEAFDKNSADAMPAALAVELFHNFSLIHDDIMDDAPLRRGNVTVHEKWDQHIAILSGDVLLVKAYDLLTNYNSDVFKELMVLFNRTAAEVCEGQQMDMDFESLGEVDEQAYIEMIRLKTSVLLGCALEMGAIVGGASQSDRKLMYTYGQHMGIAFQIQDDILDLYADPEKFGKQVGGDVLANKKTLLYIKAMEIATEKQELLILDAMKLENPVEKVKQVRSLFDLLNVRSTCEDLMNTHHQKALLALKSIGISEEHKTPLKDLAAYLMKREV
jgi:geranylgeranyl diphosphate synthase type II